MSEGRVTFARVVRSEAVKLRTLRSTLWCSAVIVVLAVGFAALQAFGFVTFFNDPRFRASGAGIDLRTVLLLCATSGTQLASLVAAVLGVLVITGEFGTGMVRSTFAAVPGRIPALVAKAMVVVALTFVASLVGTVLATLLSAAILGGTKVDTDLGSGELWVGVLGAAVFVALVTVFAFGVGELLRNSAAGIATALGVILVLQLVVGGIAAAASIDWLQNLATFLPSGAGARLYASGAFADGVTTTSGVVTLNAWAGGGVLLGWALLLAIVGAVIVRRRDV